MGDDQALAAIDELVSTSARWAESPEPEVVNVLANLIQAYAIFTDRVRRDELASLFTPDAKWDGTGLGYGVAEGPDAIADTVLQHFDPERPMVHLPGPPLLVEISDCEVNGVSWCLASRGTTDGAGPLIFFHYHDAFRRDDAGAWRFARRTLRLRFRSGG